MHEDRLSELPKSSRRARWTLALAVVVSVLLVVGATVVLSRRDSDSTETEVSLPGPWEPTEVDYVLVSNPDARVHPGAIERLIAAHARVRRWKLATADEHLIEQLPPSAILAL